MDHAKVRDSVPRRVLAPQMHYPTGDCILRHSSAKRAYRKTLFLNMGAPSSYGRDIEGRWLLDGLDGCNGVNFHPSVIWFGVEYVGTEHPNVTPLLGDFNCRMEISASCLSVCLSHSALANWFHN